MNVTPATSTSRLSAVVAGIVSGAAALGAGELVGGLRENWQSPVVGVAEATIARVPRAVKDFGVERFGTNDCAGREMNFRLEERLELSFTNALQNVFQRKVRATAASPRNRRLMVRE